MTISPFFEDLRSAYQSELDDLRFDSDGDDVLSARLADKRGELDFLIQMMRLSPEMVAVIFHKGFSFHEPAMMDNLIAHAADELPEWDELKAGIGLQPWAEKLANVVLKQADGEWFLSVAAALEYMNVTPGTAPLRQHDEVEDEEDDYQDEDDGQDDEQSSDQRTGTLDSDEDLGDDAKSRRDNADDWMSDQGFERKN